MTTWKKVGIAIATALAVTLLAFIFSFSEMSKVDGSKPTAPFVFPFALLTAHIFVGAKWTFLILALAQFPVYGVVLGRAWIRNRVGRVLWRLAVVHTLLGLGCAWLYSIDP